MTDPSPKDFDRYAGAYYRQKLKEANDYLDSKTLLPFFELFLLRIIWANEHGFVDYGGAPQDDPARHFVLKLVHEGRALAGALWQGSIYGAYHHGRTLIELAAVTHYLFGDGTKTGKRLRRWREYRRVYHYIHRRKVELDLEAGKIAQEEFDEQCLVPAATDVKAEVVADWAKLYDAPNRDLLKVSSWHPPFKNMIEILARDARFEADYRKTYDQFSHATHLSPLSAGGFVGGWKLVAIKPDAVLLVLLTAFKAIGIVLDLIPDVGPQLNSLAVEEIRLFKEASASQVGVPGAVNM